MTQTCERTCAGHCCAVFSWPHEWDPEKTQDGLFIADMLIPLTSEEAKARAAKFRFDIPDHWLLPDTDRGLFTCRHWDEESRLCTVYETRPGMCRNFPYDGACQLGCSYVAGDDVRALYRLSKEARSAKQTKKHYLTVIIGDGRGKRVPAHRIKDGASARTVCGLSLARARNVWVTETTKACRSCRRISNKAAQ